VEALRGQLDDITTSRKTLSRLQHQLLRMREQERGRLARELHDGPIQTLVSLNIQLGLLVGRPEVGDAATPLACVLNGMRAEVRALLNDLRQVCADLRPPMLDTLGLGAALRALAEEWSAQHETPIQLDLAPDAALRDLPGEAAVNLYRVAQEALTNVARHASARHVTLSLQWAYPSDELCLAVEDDGHGFAPAALNRPTEHGHFGLAAMQERVTLIGGRWQLESAPSQGTKVCVRWLPPENKETDPLQPGI
jgi:signal transduction histidine kinase